MYDVIIIGSGPAGLTAAIYASRARLKTLLVTGVEWGGQLMLTTEVENFPGFKEGILGPDLLDQMWKQAERFGTEFLFDNAKAVDFSIKPFKVTVGDKVEGGLPPVSTVQKEPQIADRLRVLRRTAGNHRAMSPYISES